MPILDSLPSPPLTDHLSTLVTRMTLGSSGGDASSRDGEQGRHRSQSPPPQVTKIDDRTNSGHGQPFDTQQTSSQAIKEVALHGDTVLDTLPSYRATFLPINKNSTNEIKVDVLDGGVR